MTECSCAVTPWGQSKRTIRRVTAQMMGQSKGGGIVFIWGASHSRDCVCGSAEAPEAVQSSIAGGHKWERVSMQERHPGGHRDHRPEGEGRPQGARPSPRSTTAEAPPAAPREPHALSVRPLCPHVSPRVALVLAIHSPAASSLKALGERSAGSTLAVWSTTPLCARHPRLRVLTSSAARAQLPPPHL